MKSALNMVAAMAFIFRLFCLFLFILPITYDVMAADSPPHKRAKTGSDPLPQQDQNQQYISSISPSQPFNPSSHSSSSSPAPVSGSLSKEAEITPLKAYEELRDMISKAPINIANVRKKLTDFNAEDKLDGANAAQLVAWLTPQKIDQLKGFIEEKIKSLQELKVTVTPYSSEVGGTVKDKIFAFLNEAQRRITLVSDQFTDGDITQELIRIVKARSLKLQILVGDNNKSRDASPQEENINALGGLPCRAILSGRGVSSQSKRTCVGNTYYAPQIGNQNRYYKMHNKFIVVDDKVLLGSPNATQTAYEMNIESFVVIEDIALANLYETYYRYMLSQAAPTGQNVQGQHQFDISGAQLVAEMNHYNHNGKIQVCLAPVCPIKNFIISKLQGASDIKINMFLISKYEHGDIVDTLRNLDQKIPISLNIDHNMYINSQDKSGFFVHEAVKSLIHNKNITIRKIILRQDRASFHDKLILIKQGNKKSVIIGSAGFTKDVQENQNYENMVFIEDDQVYDALERHMKKFIPDSGEYISGKVSQIDQAYPSLRDANRSMASLNVGFAKEPEKIGDVYWVPRYFSPH